MPHAPTTLPHLTDEGLARNRSGLACVTKRDGQWHETTIEAFRARVAEVALGLYDAGIRRGDRIALHAENSTEWLIVDQAALSIGAVTVPIYTTQPSDQIRYIVDHSEARLYLVSSESLFSGVAASLTALPHLEGVVGLFGSYRDDMRTLADLADAGRALGEERPHLLPRLRAGVAPDDLATIVYTSGTTGRPKGVMLTHDNLGSNLLAVKERASYLASDRQPDDAVLSFLPLSHVLERMATLMYLHLGLPIYFTETIEEILEDLQAVRPIHFSTVPRLLEKIHAGIRKKADALSGVQRALLRWALHVADGYDVEQRAHGWRHTVADRLVYRKMRDLFGGRLRGITSGGAALAPEVMRFFNAIGIRCGQGYGMTETSPVISVYEPETLRLGTAGRPIRGIEVRIADDGEILTRGPHVMRGYYKEPEKTAEVIDDEGWMHTGDIGHLDTDGYVYITDRKKQLLKLSTGKYIAPQPIEIGLAARPYVEQAVVIGNECRFCSALIVPDREAVALRLAEDDRPLDDAWTTHPDVLALIQRQVDAVNEGLPPWEQVKKFRLLSRPFSIDGGELTPTLKVKRQVVQQKYAEEITALYA